MDWNYNLEIKHSWTVYAICLFIWFHKLIGAPEILKLTFQINISL